MDKKRLAINMAAQLLAFAVNMGISFFLAPIIEAQMANTYGFVTLANQFVLYAQIVVSALNTMASRFVTIHIHRGEEQEAREYFSSVFFGNVIMAGIFLLPALVIVIFMGNLPFLHVPADALYDVQLLWAFVFLNFFLSIIMSIYSVSTYAMNRLDLTSIRSMYAGYFKNYFPVWNISVVETGSVAGGCSISDQYLLHSVLEPQIYETASARYHGASAGLPVEKSVGADLSGGMEFSDPSWTAASGRCGYSSVRCADPG